MSEDPIDVPDRDDELLARAAAARDLARSELEADVVRCAMAAAAAERDEEAATEAWTVAQQRAARAKDKLDDATEVLRRHHEAGRLPIGAQPGPA